MRGVLIALVDIYSIWVPLSGLYVLVTYFIGTVINPGDEVILFDPSYETYGGCITMAGGIPVCFLSFLRTLTLYFES